MLSTAFPITFIYHCLFSFLIVFVNPFSSLLLWLKFYFKFTWKVNESASLLWKPVGIPVWKELLNVSFINNTMYTRFRVWWMKKRWHICFAHCFATVIIFKIVWITIWYITFRIVIDTKVSSHVIFMCFECSTCGVMNISMAPIFSLSMPMSTISLIIQSMVVIHRQSE